MKKQKFNNYFGLTLKEFRNEKNLTQKEAAKLSGMDQKMWSSYEVGKSRPNLDTIILIANGLGLDPIVLVSRALSKQRLLVDFTK